MDVYYTKNTKMWITITNKGISENKSDAINPLKTELNPIFHLLALLGAHHILHISIIRIKIIKFFEVTA